MLEGKVFLLVMDAHNKWMEIHMMNSSTSSAMIELLWKMFASLELPEVVVSDNVTAFTSAFTNAEFTVFLHKNGIHHIRPPQYHPASKRLVERAV